MTIRFGKFALTCLLLPASSWAQQAKLNLPDFSGLKAKATESVNISISPWLLRTAAVFMDDKDPDSAATKALLAGIKSIQIRNFEFSTDFAYSSDDIDAVRHQLAGPGWSQLLQIHNRDRSEDVDMYILIENNQTKGFALIASEPREFTIVNIVGSINVEDLPKLQKQLHLPKITGQANLLM